jgi:hypothetical protein
VYVNMCNLHVREKMTRRWLRIHLDFLSELICE